MPRRRFCPSAAYRLPSTRRSRPAFTLIELLVAISIIGILAAMALGGMWRASVAAKRTNSKTTVNKLAAQISEIWESYRNRKLPIDPKLVLQSNGAAPYTVQFNYAVAWLQYFSQVRVAYGASAIYPDPQAPVAYNGVNPHNNLQIAAIKLATVRELMRWELPCKFADFTSSTSGSPSNALPVVAQLIPQPPSANPGGLSEQYRQFFRTHANTFNTDNESAECLYMIIKFASQNELGQTSITDDPRLVGDSDGDGMPEIQDAFLAGTFTAPPAGSPFIQHNKPIAFVRWPAGYLSDLQPGPSALQYKASNPTAAYAAARHDIFDPLRIDPRAFTITPLIFSAGSDGTYDIWEHNSYPTLTAAQKLLAQNDPYFTENASQLFPVLANTFDAASEVAPQDPLPGAVMDRGTVWPSDPTWPSLPMPNNLHGGYADNITNHSLSTRSE